MENTELDQNSMNDKTELSLDKNSLSFLTEIRKWTMFFAILGFIGIGFMVLGALFMGIFGSIGGIIGNKDAALFGVLTVVYILLGLVYFFPVLYLLKFSTNMKMAVEQFNQNKLTSAFEFLKSHFKYMGIFTISFMGLYIIGIVVFMLVGLASVF